MRDFIYGRNVYGISNIELGLPFWFNQDEKGNYSDHTEEFKDIIIGEHTFFNPYITIEYGVVRDTIIGDNTKVDSFVMIGHDSQIGRSVLLNTGVKILGKVTIGDFSKICAGAIIHQGVTIGKNCIIGVNSYVRHDVPDNTVVYGNPASVKTFYKYPHKIFK